MGLNPQPRSHSAFLRDGAAAEQGHAEAALWSGLSHESNALWDFHFQGSWGWTFPLMGMAGVWPRVSPPLTVAQKAACAIITSLQSATG